jgi:hypothetical protein
MTTVNYPTPVTVNGYSCKNCTDVDNAKRNIDPAHPQDGPFGVNRVPKPGEPKATGGVSAPGPANSSPAVVFGGQLAQLNAADASPPAASATQGHRLDLSV